MANQYPMFGRYQLLGELGRGGMGVVYKAYDTKRKSLVALKVILCEEPEYIERFLMEISAIAKLNHPNIVRFYEYGTAPRPHFTMEYIEGSTLSDLIKNRNIKAGKLVNIMIYLCEALHYAHQNNIIHRDIKPSNIMISQDGTAKIMDFGLAKISDKTKKLSRSGQMLGTVAYMAPEQVDGKATYQSDIYSLGASLYEGLTYRSVFQGETEINIICQIMDNFPIPPRQLNPDISPYLEAICLKCLSKKPQKRYNDFKVLAKEFKNFQGHRPIIAKKYTSWDVVKNFVVRHKVICGSLMAIFVVLVLSLMVIFSAWTSAEKAKTNAQQAAAKMEHAIEKMKQAVVEMKQEKNNSKLALNKVMSILNYSMEKYEILQRDKKFAMLFSEIFQDLEKYGENQNWNFIKGYVSAQSGDTQKSIEYYRKQIKQHPQSATAYANLGNRYREIKQYQKALESFAQALSIDPLDSTTYNNRALTYQELKQYQKALADFEKAEKINPKYANAYNNHGNLYRELGERKKAISYLKKAIEVDAESFSAYNNLGNIYHEMRQYKRSLENFNAAIRHNDQYTKAYNNRGLLYRDLKKYNLAMSDFNKAISLNAASPDIYNNRALLYEALGKYQFALEDYREIFEINPRYSRAYNNRGLLYCKLKKYDLALQDYNKAIEINPRYLKAYRNRGILYAQIKKYPLAMRDFNAALQLNPNDADLYHNRGTLYKDLQQNSLALADYNKSIQLSPNYSGAYTNRGALHAQAQKYKRAIKDFKKAISIFPDMWQPHYGLHLCYKNLNRPREANYHWQKVQELRK
ncbi:serine/threonine-protein kinase [Candidatus Uabimicrobium amorphum]|uniref:non-specific serine/threonine protein kinase n=1 Tax=Uabimicrobium amorphum TaxID=2596890 RepID=A0A5S9IPX4_UABAM|nr:serine/threonine-protein kinase [Candidatus Uabimicrobium amorphum]BBM84525.1 serine/threonine protein kinase [Candidatus Uabimicrobium amorphum]